MSEVTTVRKPAEVYDEFFVPALFAQWGPVVTAAAGIKPGDCVLDVACGTGAPTLAVAERVGPTGSVVGLDANPDMLAVARCKPAPIEWLDGRAEALPAVRRQLRCSRQPVRHDVLRRQSDGAARDEARVASLPADSRSRSVTR